MNSEWKNVPWAPKYLVSSNGEVVGPRGWKLKPIDRGNGYLAVNIFPTKDKGFLTSIHTLVLEVFAGEKPTPSHHGCHNDGDKTNNRLTNLRWDTPKENIADQFRHGTFASGSRHGASKLSEAQVEEIRSTYVFGKGTAALADRYSVSKTMIKRIVSGKAWRHVQ